MKSRLLLMTLIASVGLFGCNSSGYSGSASYRVNYYHGYGYPGYYPRGYMGPPIYVRPRPPIHRPPGHVRPPIYRPGGPSIPRPPGPTPRPMPR